MRYRFYAHDTGREDFNDWCSINYVVPNSLSIKDRYEQNPDEFGAALHEERATPDGNGRYCTYEKASIHWHPLLGAYATEDTIREAWKSQGWENGWLGLPVSEEFQVSQDDIEDLISGRWDEWQGEIPRWCDEVGRRWGEMEGEIPRWRDLVARRRSKMESGIPPEMYAPAMRASDYGQAQQFYGGMLYWVRATNEIVFLKRSERNYCRCRLFDPPQDRLSKDRLSWIQRLFARFSI